MALKVVTRSEQLHNLVYREGQEDLATFSVRIPTPSILNKIVDKNTKVTWDAPDKKTPKQRFEKVDFLQIVKDKFDYCVVEWLGVEDQNGNTLDCTTQNKMFFFENMREVANWVNDQIDEIAKINEDEKEQEVKN